jgi:hypothetical protein
MFRFTRKPSSGSHSQYLAKITHLVQRGYIDVVQTLSVLWLHSMTCEACVLVNCVIVYCICLHSVHTHASQVILCSHNTDNVCTTSMYPR